MYHPVVPLHCQPCVWMSAGVVRYKLCNRNFDCEHCPLDAGLRGAAWPAADELPLQSPPVESEAFAGDRRYADGHCWVQEISQAPLRRVRFGLDAFAAALIGHSEGVRCRESETTLTPGETAFEIDLGLGTLPVGSPLHCVVVRGNSMLETQPEKVVTDPYGEGWIVEAVAIDPAESDPVFSRDEASQRSKEDLQRFRKRFHRTITPSHRLAQSEAARLGPTMADGGEPYSDLRQRLGGTVYVTLLRELIH